MAAFHGRAAFSLIALITTTLAIAVTDSQAECVVNASSSAVSPSTSLAIGAKYTMGCDQICTCLASGAIDCKDRCRYRPGAILDPNCKEIPDEHDPDCCVNYSCKDNVEATAPKVLVTQRTATSLAIAWDDFKQPNYEAGYVVEYRLVSSNNSSDRWLQIQANNTPFLSLRDLRPQSAYQVRISVWEDGDGIDSSRNIKKQLSPTHSEVITAYTEDSPREPKSAATPASPTVLGLSSLADKSGYCPASITGRVSDEAGNCLDECQHDAQCEGSHKCCPTSCGGTVCSAVATGRSLCDSIVCGPHAECLVPDDGDAICKCKPHHTGDPNDPIKGCLDEARSKKFSRICEYKNLSYGIGEEFYDGCAKKCVCEESLEVHCQARCAFNIPEGGDLVIQSDPLCSIVQDPKDSCCKTIACKTPEEVREVVDASPPSNVVIAGDGAANTVSVNKPLAANGCRFKNQTYREGEEWFDGCDSKCVCEDEASGNLQCLPRCAPYQGFDKNFCQLVADPADPECCMIAVCDNKEPGAPHDNAALILESAEPFNSTTVRLRVILPSASSNVSKSADNDALLQAPHKLTLQLLYAKAEAHFTETERQKLHWEAIQVIGSELRVVATNVYEVDVSGLEPSTEYFTKVIDSSSNETSNTVVVRTYPPGIDASFSGCFHGNHTYEIGQVFYDGCEFKCTCRENGIRECEERCPVFIDTVGFENCEWKPAPEDPCCTIPVCDSPAHSSSEPAKSNNDRPDNPIERVHFPTKPSSRPGSSSSAVLDPASEPFCIANGQLFAVGHAWQEGSGCLRRSCECVQLNNGSTAADCKGGCAPIPPTALVPTLECPKPQMVTPEDACLCPYVVCNHNRSPISLPPSLPGSRQAPTVVSKELSPKGQSRFCDFKGRKVPIGEEVYDGCKAVCHCDSDAKLNCALVECPHHFAPHVSECLEWDIDPDFEPSPPECCPPPKCKNDGSCVFAGLRFGNFKHIPSELLPCGTRCVCANGNITCENRCPSLSDIPPADLPCPPNMAYRGHTESDTCCMHWMCREPERPAYCLVNGKRFKLNEQWDESTPANGLSISTRRRCQCKAGAAGKPAVECYPGQCPQITERHLRPSPECPVPVLVAPEEPAVMCPYVVCNHSEETGKDLDRVSLVAINASAVRIRFTLPQILIGLVGHAELHYTRDPTMPRDQWPVQKFARPKRLFDTANIEYHLGRLQPDTVYYFQIRVVVEALQAGPESEIYKLKMPPLPAITTTTTTTTLPPIIMVDAHINGIPIDFSSATIAWRPLEEHEKRLVDGVQLKYKRVEESDHSWITTPMIHRDLTSYELRDLQPGMSYIIDLVYRTAEHLMTAVVSTKPFIMDMPAKPRDEYEFHVSIDPNNDVLVDSSRSIFKLRGAPHPANKFITVAKISYRSIDDASDSKAGQMVHTFRVPTEDGSVVLEGLSPRKHYKAWIDLYLANGRRITSNVVDFMTKEKSLIDQRSDDPSANDAEALHEGETSKSATSSTSDDIRPYFIALTIVSVVATVFGVAVVALLWGHLRNKSSAKAPITRAPSESAYDNPTYKVSELTVTYDNERTGDSAPIKNGSAQV